MTPVYRFTREEWALIKAFVAECRRFWPEAKIISYKLEKDSKINDG